jgi:hypothetical protein
MNHQNLASCAGLVMAGLLLAAGSAPADAAAASLTVASPGRIEAPASPIEQVGYRRHRGYGGAGFAIGLIAGAAIASHAYRPYYYRSYGPYYGYSGHSYYRPVYYRSSRNCWWSRRWQSWVCKRHYW